MDGHQEHQVFGGEIPYVSDMEGDDEIPPADAHNPSSKEDSLEEMKKMLKEEATALREMHTRVQKEMCVTQDSSGALLQQKLRKRKLTRSIYVGNVLQGLHPVRRSPGMYIGSSAPRGLHHLLYEILNNAVDQAQAGYASKVDVLLHEYNSVSITNNGRGIPINLHPVTKKSSLETVLTAALGERHVIGHHLILNKSILLAELLNSGFGYFLCQMRYFGQSSL